MAIDAGATLQTAALALLRPGIGLLVACDKDGRAAGVISKSDLVRCLTWPSPTDVTATDLMSSPVVSCSPNDDLYDTWKMMAAQSLQNIPVLDQDLTPLGVLDIRDAMKTLFEQEAYQERLLVNYVAGIGYQ
jgi:signal-transduction protein with cAMP-binding, CBS, and nucleotidyltransferase domain